MTEKFKTIYDRLNTKQREAVDTIYGSVMVVAGPGTGKTQVLSARASRILELTDAKADNILITTFTEAGVVALKKRLFDFLGTESYKVKVTTLHAFAKDVIDRFPEAFLKYRAFRPIDDLGAYMLLEEVLENGEYPLLRPVYSPDFYLRDISGAMKNLRKEGISPVDFSEHIDELEKKYSDVLSEIKPTLKKYEQTKQKQETQISKLRELRNAYEAYEALKREKSSYDFEDMILFASEALHENPMLASELAEQYQFIMIDEFQDLSSAQNSLIEAVLSVQDAPNILTVGDDDQSIYRFQWANLENMFHFSSKFADTKIIVLEENYRSTADVLDTARILIENNTSRIVRLIPSLEKPLKANRPNDGVVDFSSYQDPFSETMSIIEKIKLFQSQGIPYEEMAILVRTNREVREWSSHLANAEIPYESREQWNLLETDEYRLVSSVLSILEFDTIPDREFIELLKTGIWSVKFEDIYRLCRELSHYNYSRRIKASLFDYLIVSEENRELLFVDRKEAWDAMIETVLMLRSTSHSTLSERLSFVLETLGLKDFVRKKAWMTGLGNLFSLVEFAKEREYDRSVSSLRDILGIWERMKNFGIALPGLDIATGGKTWVKVYTAHQSKWLEFEVVFVPNVGDRIWGNRRVIEKLKLPDTIVRSVDGISLVENEEERRLFFVALTRAKRFLFASFCESDGKAAKLPSQFMAECKREMRAAPAVSENDVTSFLMSELSSPKSFYGSEWLTDCELSFISEMLQNYRLSASDLSKFLEDPRRFLEEAIFRYPFADTPATIFGKTYHKTLEEFYLTWKKEKVFPSKEDLLRLFEKNLKKEVLPPEIFDNDLEKGKEWLSGWYDLQSPSSGLPLELEYGFSGRNVSFEGIPLTGKIDRIDELTPGVLRVIDYKTGRVRSENEMKWLTESSEGDSKYFRQLVFYKILLSLDPKFSKHEVGSLMIDFVEGKGWNYRSVEMPCSEEEEEAIKNEIRTAWGQITDLGFWKTYFSKDASPVPRGE